MWQIEHQCPQCSAPVTLEETERLFVCPYCRVRLYIASESALRYYLPPARLQEQIAYVPYWRSKGIQFTCRSSGITTGVIDRTSRAHSSSCFPYSLGVRPQVFKLRFVGQTVEKALLQPSVVFEDASEEVPMPTMPIVMPDGSPIADPILFRVAMREVESLIFSPVSFQGDTLCDAIDGKNLGKPMDEVMSGAGLPGEAQGEVTFIPALCPNCGADLIGEKESVILFCSNCDLAWRVSGNALHNAGFAFLPGAQDALYLPFWCMEVHLEGMEKRLFIDPAKTGRLDGRHLYLDKSGFFFWVPAFKVNPSLFLTLAERATVGQSSLDDAVAEVAEHLYPVTLPAEEAAKLVMVLLHLLVGKREGVGPSFTRATVRAGEPRLYFIPFSSSGYELTQQKLRMSVHQNALKYGKNL
jgi:DNA-directed RNA polymerase subunit RPC12/RpoP